MSYTLEDLARRFDDLVAAVEALASCVHDETFHMKDVDRGAVYREHLGGKLTGTE